MTKGIIVKTSDIVKSGLWRLFPVINVDYTDAIPTDYPGLMGIPVSALCKILRNSACENFILLDKLRPKIKGKEIFFRAIIRNLKPNLPEYVDLAELLYKAGVELEISESD